jgi:hypothetical protein
MLKRTVLLTLLATLVLAVTAWAATPSAQATGRAEAACKALQGKLGATVFTQSYGTFGACVASLARVEQQNVEAAQAACTAEQSDANFAATHGGQTFAQFYGAGPKGKNAFAHCVTAKAQASSQAEGQSRPNPARMCSAQRTQMTAGPFASFYGKNANDRNAFGKCVSSMAHAQVQNELSAAAACRAEQADAGFAAAHAGKTFAQTYGTNDLNNAFGKCVAGKAKAKTQAEQEARIAAVKACAAERKANASAFKAKYSSFRSCVSQHGG